MAHSIDTKSPFPGRPGRLETATVRPRTLALLLGLLVFGTGLVILLVPKTVQTGNPVLGQMREEEDLTDTYSCGSPFTYALGNRPWEDDDPVTYQNLHFVRVSTVCPGWLESNLRAGLLWAGIGGVILIARQVVIRRGDRREAARQPQPSHSRQ
jgi:hypothetical protein